MKGTKAPIYRPDPLGRSLLPPWGLGQRCYQEVVEHIYSCQTITHSSFFKWVPTTYLQEAWSLSKRFQGPGETAKGLRSIDSIFLSPPSNGEKHKSWKFLKHAEDNFLTKILSESTRKDALLDLLFDSREGLVIDVTVGYSLGWSDHEIVELKISGVRSKKGQQNCHTLDFKRERASSSSWS